MVFASGVRVVLHSSSALCLFLFFFFLVGRGGVPQLKWFEVVVFILDSFSGHILLCSGPTQLLGRGPGCRASPAVSFCPLHSPRVVTLPGAGGVVSAFVSVGSLRVFLLAPSFPARPFVLGLPLSVLLDPPSESVLFGAHRFRACAHSRPFLRASAVNHTCLLAFSAGLPL